MSGYTGTYNLPWYTGFWSIIEWPNDEGHTWVCDGCEQHTMTVVSTTTEDGTGQSGEQTDPTSPDEPYTHVIRTVFKQGYLHMNWGWGTNYALNIATNNGWYNYSVNYTQASPSSQDFQYFQTVVYNIYH